MPAIALPPQPVPAMVSRFDFWRESGQRAHGETGRKLQARADQAHEHWLRRAEVLISANDLDDFFYNSVPPNRSFSVRTRYVFRGKGGPLPFTADPG